jgi:hypothetical protein
MPREVFVGPDRPRPVAAAVEDHEQPAQGGLVIRRQLQPASQPPGHVRRAALLLGSLGQRACRACGERPESRALPVEPGLEFRGGAGHMNAVEKGASVELQGATRITRGEGPLQRAGIAPEALLGRPYFIFSSRRNRLGPELAPKEVERPPERGTGVLRIQLRPEQREQ